MAWNNHTPKVDAVALAALCALTPYSAFGQQGPAGFELGGLPAINFDADEGFGYGAIVEMYSYGHRGLGPYEWTIQPTVFLTTEGRRDFVVFFDAPHLLPEGWRVDVFLGSEKQIATPFYGLGNETTYDENLDLESGPDPFFYRFGRTRRSATFNLQKPVGESPLRALFGGGLVQTRVDAIPEDEGVTLYALTLGPADQNYWSNYVRGGLIWDTRDRETGPRSGAWTELLLQWVDEGFGADTDFLRWTFTDRRYVSLGERVVLAHRYLVQGVSEQARPFELFQVQTSFKQQEGLGGAKTVRGVLKNRFVGRGMLVWNTELRWRVADFRMLGRPFHTVLSAFFDQGRVWDDGVDFGELLTDLQRGYGGGVRFGMGENFTVAFDVGTSKDGGMPFYIGLGYLY